MYRTETACIYFSVLSSHIFSGYRIVTMIQPAGYVERILMMMDVANVYDYSAMVSANIIIQS